MGIWNSTVESCNQLEYRDSKAVSKQHTQSHCGFTVVYIPKTIHKNLISGNQCFKEEINKHGLNYNVIGEYTNDLIQKLKHNHGEVHQLKHSNI